MKKAKKITIKMEDGSKISFDVTNCGVKISESRGICTMSERFGMITKQHNGKKAIVIVASNSPIIVGEAFNST